MLEKDLDIFNLIDLMKTYRILRKVVFDQNQLFFLKHQKHDILDFSESNSANDDEYDQNLLEMQISNNAINKLSESIDK